MSKCFPATSSLTLTTLPDECQVHILTYLRAFDLSPVQQTCKFYLNKDRIHEVVNFFVERVYGPDLTKGVIFDKDDADNSHQDHVKNLSKHAHGSKSTSGKCIQDSSPPKSSKSPTTNETKYYTLEHLRAIELAVVARVLSLPEPKTGFYVSKSWIKKALLWLETVNEPSTTDSSNNGKTHKKLSKKKQRQRNRRLSDVSPPWPNANSDILCEHQNLQRCSAKAARSRRKLMDKHSWKVLRKLYPDSTTLESVRGECLQCLMETEAAKKTESDRLEQEKMERKKPLANALVRQFYTRTKGVPMHCLVDNINSGVAGTCPLVCGKYVILPRSWCHQWRRYVKTGEGSLPLPPDSSALLCDAHKLALLPPHLEAFLCGETAQLLASVKYDLITPSPVSDAAVAAAVSSPVGVPSMLDLSVMNSLIAAGISQGELASQRSAMMQIQDFQQQASDGLPNAPRRESWCNNELLDRENHVVVELVSQDEWKALQDTGYWPKQLLHYSITVDVGADGRFLFSTLPCRDCDASGLRFTSCASVKNKFRSKRWEPKSVEQKRTPNLEY